ncbi:MAG: radical SAM protein [Nitrospirae bacterium]|nr:radical SAM protein [Nitrospirota bacterium]
MKDSEQERDLVIEKEPYIFARPWHRQFPPMLVVSITNACNLRCSHCYYSTFSKRSDYHVNMLPWDIWEEICLETSQWPGVIMNFGTDGEPLLHPRLIEMLMLARKNNIFPINITTNGLLMDAKFSGRLIDEHLVDVINISLDAFTSETYAKIRGGDFERLAKNVHTLIDLRNAAKSPLKIQVNFINQPDSRAEVEAFRQYWDGRADLVMIRTYYDSTSVTGETGPNITGKQDVFEKTDRWPCQQLWRRFNISDDGTVRFCVDDWFNKSRIGDLKTQTISEIWTGEEYNRLRNLHISGQFEKVPYCMKCTEWQGMKWDYDYFTAIEKLLGKKFV